VRGHIFKALVKRMADDKTLFFLTGDMGINLVEVIEQQYPSRFLNVGIAEQNLIGIAAGLCNAGYRPVAYTISNFLIHRCLEQIRDDVALHQYPVILLGTGGGFDNAPLGPTHHIVDEWGIIRGFPGIDIYAPASVEFAASLFDRILEKRQPTYIRCAKGSPSIPTAAEDVSYVPGNGSGPLLISYGALASECIKAQARRADLAVLVVNRIHPIEVALTNHLAKHAQAFVVEDHFGHTGLYSSLCQLAMQQRLDTFIRSIAPPLDYDLVVGQSSDFYHRKYGLDAAGILGRLAAVDGET